MTISIPLSYEAETRLRQQAEASGKDLESLVLEAVEEKLAVLDDAGGTNEPQGLSASQWIARLHQWAASHRRLPYEADNSRESIYEGRGE